MNRMLYFVGAVCCEMGLEGWVMVIVKLGDETGKDIHRALEGKNWTGMLGALKEIFHSNLLPSDSTYVQLKKKVFTVFLSIF